MFTLNFSLQIPPDVLQTCASASRFASIVPRIVLSYPTPLLPPTACADDLHLRWSIRLWEYNRLASLSPMTTSDHGSLRCLARGAGTVLPLTVIGTNWFSCCDLNPINRQFSRFFLCCWSFIVPCCVYWVNYPYNLFTLSYLLFYHQMQYRLQLFGD
jgi:hypothetical protein